MANIVDPEKRSKKMAGIRGQDTKPELVVRKSLIAVGYHFRLHRRDLPAEGLAASLSEWIEGKMFLVKFLQLVKRSYEEKDSTSIRHIFCNQILTLSRLPNLSFNFIAISPDDMTTTGWVSWINS